MKRLLTEAIRSRRMPRRQLLAVGIFVVAVWAMTPLAGHAAAVKNDLEIVAQMPKMAERDGPLLVLRDFVKDPDLEVKRYIRRELSQKDDLYALLKRKIDFDKQVQLSVKDVQVRLMYVPQRPAGPGEAYQRYCRSILTFLFEMIQTDNFYTSITSPDGSLPPLDDSGVTAFLVHRLAKAYQATCRFTAESGRFVEYRASGAIFSNHLGAVDLEIEFVAPRQVRLKRKPFTIWQNNSEDVYTLLSLPVEETLHYYVGRATDHQLAEALRLTPPRSVTAAQQLAEEWIAVEESIVGGLVTRVVKEYCTRNHMAVPPMDSEEMRSSEPTLLQYKYRRYGVALVREMGFHEALTLYMGHPDHFRELVVDRYKEWSVANRVAAGDQAAN